MALKKMAKADKDKEINAEFLREFELLQQKYDKALGCYLKFSEAGITPGFRIIPYPKESNVKS
jgi:hypothetical protein